MNIKNLLDILLSPLMSVKYELDHCSVCDLELPQGYLASPGEKSYCIAHNPSRMQGTIRKVRRCLYCPRTFKRDDSPEMRDETGCFTCRTTRDIFKAVLTGIPPSAPGKLTGATIRAIMHDVLSMPLFPDDKDEGQRERYFFRCPWCKGEAFEFKTMPNHMDPLLASNVIHVDNPKAGDEMKCQLCHREIMEGDLKIENIYTEFEFSGEKPQP